MKKKIIFIVNPISGHHNKNHFPNLVESSIDKNKYDYTIVFTEYANHATELTMKAIEDGYEYIAAVGGDGTINEVVNGLNTENVKFGIKKHPLLQNNRGCFYMYFSCFL